MQTLDLPLEGHLDELRTRLLVCLIPAVVLLVPLLMQSGFLLTAVFSPLLRLGMTVSSYHVTDGLMLRLRLAITVDVLLLLPLALWQGYAFMRPGLYTSERRLLSAFLAVGTVLFYFAIFVFFAKLTPMLAEVWYRKQTVSVIISAGRYLFIWQSVAIAFGVLLALFPVGLFLIWQMKKWRKSK